MNQKKYELTTEVRSPQEGGGRVLYRIRSLKDFVSGVLAVKAGDLGGFVENESNLSQDDTCWIAGDAAVYNEATVREDALVYGDAVVKGHSVVAGNATVGGKAVLDNGVSVFDFAKVYGNAVVAGYVRISDNAEVSESAMIMGGHCHIMGNAKVRGHAYLTGSVCVYDDAEVYGGANVSGYATVCGSAKVYGYAAVQGNARVDENAVVNYNSIVNDNTLVTGMATVTGVARVCGKSVVSDGVVRASYDTLCCGPIGCHKQWYTLNISTGTVCSRDFRGSLEEFKNYLFNSKEAVSETETRAYSALVEYFTVYTSHGAALEWDEEADGLDLTKEPVRNAGGDKS